MKKFLNILIIILIIAGVWLLATKVMPMAVSGQFNLKTLISLNPANKISLNKINNLGYTFYLGEIENGNSLITDTFKNEITKIIYDTKFPKSLLKDTAIVIVNSLAVKPDQYIKMGNERLEVYDFGSSFLYEGGLYVLYNNSKSVIYINKDILVNKKTSLKGTLTHELGHVIERKLTKEDWKEYYKLRNIPTETKLDKNDQLWNLSPREDFAEVYKNVYTDIDVRTFYGYLKPTWEFGLTCGNNGSQNCKIKVLSNPDKYPNDFVLGIPYKSIVDQKTKDFIRGILKKFN